MSHGLGRDGWPSDETIIKSRETEIESLRQQLAMFNSAVEHVTENGKTKRSFSVSEGWAMVHKDRLMDLECAEEQLAASQAHEVQMRDALERAVETIEWMRVCTAPADDEVEKAIREGNAAIASVNGGAPHRAWCMTLDVYETDNTECSCGKETISTPSDTTALSAMIAKAGEVMRERAAEKAVNNTGNWGMTPNLIRALPDVTLEDLK